MSVDKLRILAESHMAFYVGDKIDIQWHRQTDQPKSISSSLKACSMRMIAKRQALGCLQPLANGLTL